MSYGDDNDPEASTIEELQDAADNGDTVTTDELTELYPDKTANEIYNQIDNDQKAMNASAPQMEEPRMAAIQGRKTYHNGPKGVLTDYEEAKLKQRARRLNEKLKKEKKIYMNLDTTNKLTPFMLKQAINSTKNNKQSINSSINEQKYDSDENEDTNKGKELDDDDQVLQLYKQQKLEIFEKNRPRYGNCMEINAFTFDKDVENAPKGVWVILHIYQDYMERCVYMNRALNELAIAYPHIKFLRARSDRIGLDTYSEIGMPTLIVFKDGKQLQNHIAMHLLIGTPFTAKQLEKFFIEQKVINPNITLPEKPNEDNRDEYLSKYGQKKNKYSRNNGSVKITGTNSMRYDASNNNSNDSDSDLDID